MRQRPTGIGLSGYDMASGSLNLCNLQRGKMPAHRKADKLHELHSTTPHDRAAEVGSPLVAGRPKCPQNLSNGAKRVFKKLVKQLQERQSITPGDQSLLTLYATVWDRWQQAQAAIQSEGLITTYIRLDSNSVAHDIRKTNLHLKIVQDSERQLVGILDRLGLSPLSASKIKPTKASPDEDETEISAAEYERNKAAHFERMKVKEAGDGV